VLNNRLDQGMGRFTNCLPVALPARPTLPVLIDVANAITGLGTHQLAAADSGEHFSDQALRCQPTQKRVRVRNDAAEHAGDFVLLFRS